MNTHNTVKRKSPKINFFYIHFQTNNIKTIFPNDFSSKIDTF